MGKHDKLKKMASKAVHSGERVFRVGKGKYKVQGYTDTFKSVKQAKDNIDANS